MLLASYGGEIVDISPLANLTQLETINLSGNKIIDMTPLENLTHLTHLELSGNKIIDITPLANLTHLTHLELSSNKIINITPLANLTQLTHLELTGNHILDHSPLDALSLEHFTYDQACDMPPLPLHPRLENRSFPSVATAWGVTAINQPHLSYIEKMSQYDLYFCCLSMFDLQFVDTGEGWLVSGNLDEAIERRDDFLAHNPNMIFLAVISVVWEEYETFPEDSSYWARDAQGQILPAWESSGLVNLNHVEVQQRIIERAVAVSKCGLYDGIIFDGWNEWHTGRRNHLPGVEAILRGIREHVRPDFLIGVNPNRNKTLVSMPYINGLFFEPGILDPINFPKGDGDIEEGIERRLSELEDTLSWAESNLRPPQVNLLEIAGLDDEPFVSPANLRWMRAATALSLTFSDGYVLFNIQRTGHHWYDFWDADLGRPVGEKSALYDGEVPGLYIREFTNGWAVYNHSGAPQPLIFSDDVQGVSSGWEGTHHVVPNLDGEIYLRLKAELPGDINGDGIVNILDLTLIARGFGTDSPDVDVNGDGVVNVFDLVFVANQF